MSDQTQQDRNENAPSTPTPETAAEQPEEMAEGEVGQPQAETAAEHPEETAEGEAKEEIDYPVNIEDAGTLRKKVTVTVPAKAIADKRNEMFGELTNSALVPGFRIGHAPRRLLEKRFGKEVARDVRNAVIGASLGSVLEKQKQKLRVLGQPDLDPEKIEVPEEGDLTYSFQVEVAPEFTLPPLEGIKVIRPTIEVDDARVNEALERIRGQDARLEQTGAPAADHDVVNVQMKLRGEGIEEVVKPLALRVAPGQIEGIPLVDLGRDLAGKKVGDKVTLTAKVSEAHPTEAWRGKDVTIDLEIVQVRRRVLPELDDEYARKMGYDSMADLRPALAARLKVQVSHETRRAMHEQVREYLLAGTAFELPEGVVTRHTARVMQRRAIELLRMGLTQEQVEERMTQIQAMAGDEARRDLKLSFILQRIAEDREIDVADEEINARVAAVAQQRQRRPERMRAEMESDGSLEQLVVSIQEEKVLEKLLEEAEITTAAPEAEAPGESEGAPAEDGGAPAESEGEPAETEGAPGEGEGAPDETTPPEGQAKQE